MKARLLTLVVVCAMALGLWAYSAPAQEPAPAPDYETNLLTLACSRAIGLAQKEGLSVVWCRKESEEVNGYEAIVGVRVKIPVYGKFRVTVSFRKSLWWAEDVAVEPE